MIAITVYITSSVAFAFTSQDFLAKSQVWVGNNCKNTTAKDNRNLLLCYLWNKVGEQQVAIDNHTATLNSHGRTISTEQGQIADLQSKAKNIWVYDQDNNKLGLFSQLYSASNHTTLSNARSTFFDINLNRFVSVVSSMNGGNNGKLGDGVPIAYATNNCTGQAYMTYSDDLSLQEFSSRLLRSPDNNYYIMSDHPSVVNVEIKSMLNGGGCGGYGANSAVPIIQVNPPYPAQIKLPLVYKYE